MKKKILVIFLFIISILIIYYIYGVINFNSCLKNTIKYKDKINYSTNINLKIKSKSSSSKMDYDIVKSGNIKKIVLSNTVDGKLKYRIIKYRSKDKNNKEVAYIYNGKTYDIAKKDKEIFNVRYETLNTKAIRKVSSDKYIIKMKSYDAYNMIYPKDVVTNETTNKNINVIIRVDKSNNFIKEISYEIDDMGNSSMVYTVHIENRDINNHDKINLPFKK